jgi:hypothetical protein
MASERIDITVRRLKWILLALGVIWLGCEAAAVLGYSRSPLLLACINVVALPHLPIALASAFVFYFCSRPGSRETLQTVGLGVVLAAGLKSLDLLGGWVTPLPYCTCAGLGVSSLIMLARRAWRTRGTERRQVLAVLLPACLVVGCIPLIFFFLMLTIELRPHTYDALAYAADGTFGFQVSFWMGRVFEAAPWLALTALVIYCTLPLAFMVILVLHLRGEPEKGDRHLLPERPEGCFAQKVPVPFFGLDILPSFLFVAVSGFLMYLAFPLIGPLFAFGDDFPHHPRPVAEVLASPPAIAEVPRNCMPSLHTAWALLIWWHARPLARWVRVLAGIYLGFTLLATLGYGAHYAFDVVVAFPSTLVAQALCLSASPSLRPRRLMTASWGILLTAFWLLLLRHGLSVLALSPLLTATAALGTVIFTLVQERALYRAALLAGGGGLSSTSEVSGISELRYLSDPACAYVGANWPGEISPRKNPKKNGKPAREFDCEAPAN